MKREKTNTPRKKNSKGTRVVMGGHTHRSHEGTDKEANSERTVLAARTKVVEGETFERYRMIRIMWKPHKLLKSMKKVRRVLCRTLPLRIEGNCF